MGTWKKLGLIYAPDGSSDEMHSHCQLPVLFHLHDDVYRVYFASRSVEQVSSVSYVEISLSNPTEILAQSTSPVLLPGPIGHFDQFGVFPASVVRHEDTVRMYYVGWVRGAESPLFYASIGLAISHDGGKTFERYSRAPIVGRSEAEPCLVTSPNVFKDGDVWRMSYVSGVKWERKQDGFLQSFYHIKTANSRNGIDWDVQGNVAIDFRDELETNIARSSVIKEGDLYKMWYCYVNRGVPYRMGYAESSNFEDWTRKDDEAGLLPSEDGFDNKMTCYPSVVKHGDQYYMAYNGNNFGQGGFGLAVQEIVKS